MAGGRQNRPRVSHRADQARAPLGCSRGRPRGLPTCPPRQLELDSKFRNHTRPLRGLQRPANLLGVLSEGTRGPSGRCGRLPGASSSPAEGLDPARCFSPVEFGNMQKVNKPEAGCARTPRTRWSPSPARARSPGRSGGGGGEGRGRERPAHARLLHRPPARRVRAAADGRSSRELPGPGAPWSCTCRPARRTAAAARRTPPASAAPSPSSPAQCSHAGGRPGELEDRRVRRKRRAGTAAGGSRRVTLGSVPAFVGAGQGGLVCLGLGATYVHQTLHAKSASAPRPVGSALPVQLRAALGTWLT